MPFGHQKEPKDPDKRRAKKAFTIELKEDGESEGTAFIWDIKYGEALVLAVYKDGEIGAYIEKDSGK